MIDLFKYEKLINKRPTHIATVRPNNKPNLAIVTNILVIDKNKLVISVNEMVNTPNNIKNNPYVVLTTFNENYVGLRLFGKAKLLTSGKYYKLCEDTFYNGKVSASGATKPKGVLIITIEELEEYK